MKLLLNHKDVSVNIHDWIRSPLIAACQTGRTEIVRLLLTVNGIDINMQLRYNTPLIVACEHRFTEIVTLLIMRDDIEITSRELNIAKCRNINFDQLKEDYLMNSKSLVYYRSNLVKSLNKLYYSDIQFHVKE